MIVAVGIAEVLLPFILIGIVLAVLAGLVLFVRWVWRSGSGDDPEP